MKLKKQHRRQTVSKLRKVVEFLRSDACPDESFDFSQWVGDDQYFQPTCVTVACACGWTPRIFPDDEQAQQVWKKVRVGCRDTYSFNATMARTFYDLRIYEFGVLFMAGPSYSGLRLDADRHQVANHMERCANDMGAGIDITSDQYRKWITGFHRRHPGNGGWE